MVLTRTKQALKDLLINWKKQAQNVALVPTMGCLHEGHLALVRAAKDAGNKVVVSIYVNPTQFNVQSDFDKYPRTEKRDLELLENLADAVFIPSDSEMYDSKPSLKFDFGKLETMMEGSTRPGHFNGVGIVVSKLFHIVQPDVAYFGQKDFQQCAVIEQLVRDLSFPIKIIKHPTIRAEDGLALSSRNERLSVAEREKAPHIYCTLLEVEKRLKAGKTCQQSIGEAIQYFSNDEAFRLEYLEVADPQSLESITGIPNGEVVVCIAAFLGDVRLIDNILVCP